MYHAPPSPTPSPTPSTEPYVETATAPTEEYVVTAYSVGDDYTPSHGITASGERVKAGETVACPRDIPLGTRVDIEGVGERVCEDRGGMIRNNRIDVYMTSERAALNFGKQTLDVKIIEEESYE
jgi:3D (Asp-Asp-Asp) domain-containing protein